MKINKLILHIGVHKTGSTAIQTFIYENRALLEEQQIFVPDFMFCSEHKATKLRLSIFNQTSELTRHYLNEIVVRAKKAVCNTVIISDEDLCKTGEMNLSDISILEEYFESIEVIIYCRRSDTQAESGYAFSVMWEKSKLRMTPEQWYLKNYGRNYEALAMYYEEHLSNAIIKPVSYDFNKKRLIDSFIEVCSFKEGDYLYPKASHSNISANKYMVEIMNHLNRYKMTDTTFNKVREYVVNHKDLQGGPKAVFVSYQLRVANQYCHEKENIRFSEKYNHGQPLFEEIAELPIPQGLDKSLKKAIIDDAIHKFNLKKKYSEKSDLRIVKELKLPSYIGLKKIKKEVARMCIDYGLLDTANALTSFCGHYEIEGNTDYLSENNGKKKLSHIIELLSQAFESYGDRRSINRMKFQLHIPLSIKSHVIFREVSLLCEWYGEIEAAYFYMMLAKRQRPMEHFIKVKCMAYRCLLEGCNNKNTIVLHVGANKTATTSIQSSLALNRDYLMSQGYFYPKKWPNNCSGILKYLCRDNFIVSKKYVESGYNKNIGYNDFDFSSLDTLKEELEQFEGYKYIFSGEDIHHLNYANIYRIKELLLLIIPNSEFRVIYTIRDLEAYVNSFAQQVARASNIYENYINDKKKSGVYFSGGIKKLWSIFEKEQVTVYDFNHSLLHPKGPVGYFFEQIQIDMDMMKQMTIVKENESISDRATDLLFMVNAKLVDLFGAYYDVRTKKEYITPLYTISGEHKFKITSESMQSLYPGMRKEAQWIKKHCGIDYTKFREDFRKHPVIYDKGFYAEMIAIYPNLNHIIQHVLYLCFLEQGKSKKMDVTSKEIFNNLVQWCEMSYPKVTNLNYLISNE